MNKKTKMVLIGNQLIGMVGLEETFAEFHKSDLKPDEKIKARLIDSARKENYIPPKQETIYSEALLREYSLYCQKKISGSTDQTELCCDTYQGIPRENIPWYPTVYEERCDGCKKCFDMCPQKVYLWDEKINKPKVINPFACVVGCSGCAEVCKLKAISFPPLSILDNLKSG
ncbi:MAG: ferredoxin family protein [candidate division Zixibacteria bacterium]|nr:ferredoxin family protein [candidate division Zixibacteria bacterium]